jgi:superfamily II RNA helicase
MDLDDMFG